MPTSLCVTADDIVGWGVTPTTQGIQPPLDINGSPTLARLAVWYLPPAGSTRSYFSQAASMFSRATLFGPGFAGPWLFGVVLAALFPAIALLAIRTLAVAVAGGKRRFALWVYLLAVLTGAGWALVTPAFQAPDEVDHFAYVQSLVERGQKPTPYLASPRPRWSTSEDDALIGSGMLTDHTIDDSRTPWLAADVAAYHRLVTATGDNRGNGGGDTAVAGYGPLYYLLVASGYLIASGSSPFTQLTFMRLFSVLIGALTALFTYLAVRELVPSRTWLAVLAGMLVAFEPMYSFIAGSVNNDVGIDAGAAAVAFLLVRILRRGIGWEVMLALGALLGTLPFVKPSGFDLYPLAVVALAGATWRHGSGRDGPRKVAYGLLILASSAVACYAVATWLTAVVTPPPPARGATATVATAGSTLSVVLHHPLAYLTYLWEMVLPRLPGMHPHFPPGLYPANTIFVRRGWAAFGWYDVFFPGWVYRILQGAMIVVALLGLVALWCHRTTVRTYVWELLLLVLFPIVVIAGIAAAFYTPAQRLMVAEMGRYAFPALVALAALVVGALTAFRGSRLIAVGTGLLVALLALCFASQLLTFTAFYA